MEGDQPEVKPPRLLDQVRDAIRRKHYSYRTEQAYVHWIKRFIYFSGKRHPRDLGALEVTAFLNHLSGERDVAAATQNQALSALLFLYKEVLALPLPWLNGLDHAKRPARRTSEYGSSCSRPTSCRTIRARARSGAILNKGGRGVTSPLDRIGETRASHGAG